MSSTASAVPLEALSLRQRKLVERHMALVHLALARFRGRSAAARSEVDRQDLQQEGSIALLEAVRNHDPSRHGVFAPYALARIHFALSRHVHEDSRLIRVPFITQRRLKSRRLSAKAPAHGDRQRPDELPRIVRLGAAAANRRAPRDDRPRPASASDVPSIGDMLRSRIDRCVCDVVQRMRESGRTTPERIALLARCHAERWTVPDPEARTPIRQLAREMNCSLGRITHCEERFRRYVGEMLSADPLVAELRRLARSSDTGLRHRLTPAEKAALDGLSASSTDDASAPRIKTRDETKATRVAAGPRAGRADRDPGNRPASDSSATHLRPINSTRGPTRTRPSIAS